MVRSTVAQSKITAHDITTKHEKYQDCYRCFIRSIIRRFRHGNVICETFDFFHKCRTVLTLDFMRRNIRGNHAYLSIMKIVIVAFEKCLRNERCSISAY